MPYKDAEKQRQAQHKHYEENKDKFRERRWNRRSIVRRTILEAKAGKSCVRCGEAHPACLDFHHVDPSTKTVNFDKMRRDMFPREKVLEELAKCIILCANCHRKEHYQ